MAFSYVTWEASKVPGDTINVSFPYLQKQHVVVIVEDEEVSSSLYQWTSAGTIECLAGFPTGPGRCERRTPRAGLPSEQQGSGSFNWAGANANDKTLLYMQQEVADSEAARQAVTDQLLEQYDVVLEAAADAVQAGVSANAAAGVATGAAGASAASAAASESSRAAASILKDGAESAAGAASSKADEAAGSASEAALSKSEVDVLKDAVEGLESAAATSAITATNAATATQALYDSFMSAYENFNDRYLGAYETPPTTDHDGDPLQGGALYFDTAEGAMKVWDGSQWRAAYVSFEGTPLVSANNLGDLTNVPQARINMGLGSVDNTPDSTKPVSTPQQTALDLKLDKSLIWKGNLAAYTAIGTKDPNVLYFVTP